MKNYIQEGKVLNWTNDTGAAVSSGDVVAVGGRVFIAATDIADGATGAIYATGVFRLAANSTQAFSFGDELYWDATNSELTTTASGNTYAGLCVEAKAAAGTTGKVNIAEFARAQLATIADASTAHDLNATFSDVEVEAALNALGTTINDIIARLKSLGFIA